jgi:preprotein translocase subunit YajC
MMFTDSVYAMGSAPQTTGAAGQGGSSLSFIIMMAAIFAIFYFLLIRPQSKRAKEHKIMLDNLKKGDKIITASGIYGVIEGIETNTVIVKIAENVKIKVSRSAITALRTGE